MPYVPSVAEARRLRRAVDLASFSEGERICWITSFSLLLALGGVVLALPTWPGAIGFLGGFAVLYWRLRGMHLTREAPDELRPLFGLGIGSREQRAFTALMLRTAFTGRNPLAERPEHDPFKDWKGRVARQSG